MPRLHNVNVRVIQLVLVAVALAYIGVTRTHLTAAPSLATSARATTPYASAGRVGKATSAGRASIPVSLASALDVNVVGDEVHFQLSVTNTGAKALELTFPSGQTYDVVVYDAAGGEIWRWSSGQMFTQSLRNKPLDSRETLNYLARWRHPAIHGPLVAVASLTSSNYPSVAKAEFTIP